jgi:hypothetical protein
LPNVAARGVRGVPCAIKQRQRFSNSFSDGVHGLVSVNPRVVGVLYRFARGFEPVPRVVKEMTQHPTSAATDNG